MKHIFLLSKENIPLAKEEVLAVTKPKTSNLTENILTINTKEKDLNRLAFTKKIYKFLFQTTRKKLKKEISKFNWQRIYKKDFSVRVKNYDVKQEKKLARLIWNKLKSPKVKLKNSSTPIEFLFTKTKVFCGLLLHNTISFKERFPEKRPEIHPTTIPPKLARLLVNLTGIKKHQTLLDPFCGTGAILIESSLLKCKSIGIDIREDLIEKAKKNLKHFKLKARLQTGDATTTKIKADAIATDPPYGKGSTVTMQRDKLYQEFLNNAYKNLKSNSRLVIALSKKIKIKKFKIINIIPYKVHATLTRQIYILKK